MRTTLNNIKAAVKSATGYDVELFDGDGYFYFVFDGDCNVSSTSVYVNRLSHLSVEQWVDEFKHMVA